jgi:hypothetical protein
VEREEIVSLLNKLTPREREIFFLRCQGASVKEIAQDLTTSEPTIHFHLGNIYDKLELKPLSPALRLFRMRTVFLPVFLEMANEPPKKPEEDYPKRQPSKESMEMVLRDDVQIAAWKGDKGGELVPVSPKVIDEKEFHPPPPPTLPSGKPKNRSYIYLAIGTVLGLAVAFGGFQLFGPKESSSSQPIAQPTQPVVVQLANTPQPQVPIAAPAAVLPTPTVQPTATPVPLAPTPKPKPGDILYKADWSAGRAGWAGSQDWKIFDNMLISDGTNGSWEMSIIAPYDTSGLTDFAVEAEIQVIKPLGCSSFSLVTHITEKFKGWRSAVNFCEFKGAYIVEQDTGHRPFSPGNEWHTYRVEVKGNTLRYFIDGGLIAEMTDNRLLTPGKVGLSNDEVQLQIRRFEISAL